jgi:putative membrane protein
MPDTARDLTAQPGAPRADDTPVPVVRALLAGVLMGLANLVPGISGGTMLVACGVYRRFIDAVSNATRLHLTRPTVLTLGLIVAGAALSVGALAGVIAWALAEHRWVMYSLFIGLTLGGAPVLIKLARPLRRDVWLGVIGGAAVMGALVVLQETGVGGGSAGGPVALALGGAAAAGAMILPGVSGAFLLLLMGQYETIISAIRDTTRAAADADFDALTAQMGVIVPVGVGVLVGIAGVANLLKWVMHRYERPTLGVLLGLLLAAPAGLYPFRAGVPPEIGDTIKGTAVTPENLEAFRAPEESKDWAQRAYAPSAVQVLGSLGLIAAGFGATVVISRLGGEGK